MGAGGGVLFRGCFSIREGAAEISTGGELLFGSFWEEEKQSREFFCLVLFRGKELYV